VITLERGGVMCTLDPALGGSLLSLSVDGKDVLRPSPSPPTDILEAACFPLVLRPATPDGLTMSLTLVPPFAEVEAIVM